ncbi:tyrosinase family protein [Kitasatospora atroaurantiaca]|nr:tyrosinase family protein [Kitasatospora atroaurantiaca]
MKVEDGLTAIARAVARTRWDHRRLSETERSRFNGALQAAYASGRYQGWADVHSDMSHRMHTMEHAGGPVGTQRFLPWHRTYVYALEQTLRTYEPNLRIPYWDYANDHDRPDWVWQPPNVQRGTPGARGGSLPTQATVDGILLKQTYTDFTLGLEFDAHNDVHNWCNGTITDPVTAAKDPIFWLLHANVDRIWDRWQLTHSGTPNLVGADAALDPFRYVVPASVADIAILGYMYI